MNPMNEVTLRDILEYGYYVRELSDDQLTGGVYSELWRYKYVYYELVWDDREVIHWEVCKSYISSGFTECYPVDVINEIRRKFEIA